MSQPHRLRRHRTLVRRGACATGLALLALVAVARLVLHVGVAPVLSDSMVPTFSAGDLVVTRLVDARDLRVGDVPAVVPPGESSPYVHRIVEVRPGARPVLVTRGDANGVADPWRAELTTEQVPVVVASVPAVGHLLVALGSSSSRALLVALLGLAVTALAVSQVLLVPAPRRPARSCAPPQTLETA